MTSCSEYQSQKISIKSIDLENEYYKLSKPVIDDALKKSIEAFGVLEPPLFLNKDKRYIILSGHNRLKILNQLDVEWVDSFITNDLSQNLFLKYSLLKSHRNEIGPIGKARLIQTLKYDLDTDTDTLLLVAKNINLPVEFIQRFELLDRLVELPKNLKDYLDLRDIGFKTIKRTLRLPGDAILLLDEWTRAANMRTNIFKSIVEYLFDINKRDKSLGKLKDIDLSSVEDRRHKEDLIYEAMFNIRYPEYSSLKKRADSIISEYKKKGFDIEFPRFFEGDEIELRVDINKKEGTGTIKDRLSKIDVEGLKELLEML